MTSSWLFLPRSNQTSALYPSPAPVCCLPEKLSIVSGNSLSNWGDLCIVPSLWGFMGIEPCVCGWSPDLDPPSPSPALRGLPVFSVLRIASPDVQLPCATSLQYFVCLSNLPPTPSFQMFRLWKLKVLYLLLSSNILYWSPNSSFIKWKEISTSLLIIWKCLSDFSECD